jgi:hypothetical protein
MRSFKGEKVPYNYRLRMMCDPAEDYVWRVIFWDTSSIGVEYIGNLPIDCKRSAYYYTFDTLPEWVKDRIAVLNMLPPDPNESVVYGVGRRVDEVTYWIVQPMETVGVDDPRKTCKEQSGGAA